MLFKRIVNERNFDHTVCLNWTSLAMKIPERYQTKSEGYFHSYCNYVIFLSPFQNRGNILLNILLIQFPREFFKKQMNRHLILI